jgi:hypothetical protein
VTDVASTPPCGASTRRSMCSGERQRDGMRATTPVGARRHDP